METLERAAVALGLVLFGVGLYWSWNRWRILRLRHRGNALPGLESLRPGTPAILYFTMPDCIPCRTLQAPAIKALLNEDNAHLQVIEVDAAASPKIADNWGVLSVPTTFIIDSLGRPRRVNNGIASAEKLRGQLQEIKNGQRS